MPGPWVGGLGRRCGMGPCRRYLPGWRCIEHWLSVPVEIIRQRAAKAPSAPARPRPAPAYRRYGTGPSTGPLRPLADITPEVLDAVGDAMTAGRGGMTATECARQVGQSVPMARVAGLKRTRATRAGEPVWALAPRKVSRRG